MNQIYIFLFTNNDEGGGDKVDIISILRKYPLSGDIVYNLYLIKFKNRIYHSSSYIHLTLVYFNMFNLDNIY